MKFLKNSTLISAAVFTMSCVFISSVHGQQASEVYIVGAMKHVMWDGQLGASIALDTIGDKDHLYGLGPLEYLAGEILILDGRAYSSYVVSDSTMHVEENFNIKAPFFGYANISEWQEYELPRQIQTIDQLEAFVDAMSTNSPRPFMFKVTGSVKSATIHIVNLSEGSRVSSPEEAHRGLTKYHLGSEEVEIVGFFSTEHQAVLTHHDTFVHLHLITSDRKKMGHLDAVDFQPGVLKLYMPK